jgi:hypothetical protein
MKLEREFLHAQASHVAALRLVFERCPFWILAGTLTILMKGFHGFSQSFRQVPG